MVKTDCKAIIPTHLSKKIGQGEPLAQLACCSARRSLNQSAQLELRLGRQCPGDECARRRFPASRATVYAG